MSLCIARFEMSYPDFASIHFNLKLTWEPMLYSYEVSITNPLYGPFAIIGMPSTSVVDTLELDATPSSSPEAMDVVVKMESKLTKKKGRHTKDARREKQIRKHVIQQVQSLPPICFPSQQHKPSVAKCIPHNLTWLSLWNHKQRPSLREDEGVTQTDQVKGVSSKLTDPLSKRALSNDARSHPSMKKKRAPEQVSTPPGSPGSRDLEYQLKEEEFEFEADKDLWDIPKDALEETTKEPMKKANDRRQA
ncbi:hypothetical protein Cgig2_011144 [Carnegiea gigantea]|uniref:Uncharacterized protein n=1 Tax=Carnegiea gigantea TaxID=171969 RepID=A0A9Q1GRS6_9CARY|nr:hypothetical protein Cgig2_011144 [Carnegiea gigantea]